MLRTGLAFDRTSLQRHLAHEQIVDVSWVRLFPGTPIVRVEPPVEWAAAIVRNVCRGILVRLPHILCEVHAVAESRTCKCYGQGSG